ncbi:hypothetical protein BDQ17DRAFT_1433680 [Cyathus striatus]|nr:hypothetical protein BDQ17DRAFT_1433680 [Cyathus striatus]
MNELHRKGVSSSAIEAMFSLATTVPQDLEHLYAVIEAGGTKACAWLKDKIDAKFVIPAIHHAESLIPLDVWQSSPSSTNGNEQAHRDVNRDAMKSLKLHSTEGIYVRDQIKTDFRRSQSSVTRQVSSQRRAAHQLPIKQLPIFEDDEFDLQNTHSTSEIAGFPTVFRHVKQYNRNTPYPKTRTEAPTE